ncbi:hypothetical protein GAYE_SCF08G3008 [Galdieria yellowstonensis]|uniref:Uncharacterized protein n=1 Tax=Galdieria yellowstonensis TaxID=3028027 RepID=A0AAV9ICT8_9RHOD|nr:hypothetical protein GAYE_SCF08G3008 [Galdieria yellowstonensis]
MMASCPCCYTAFISITTTNSTFRPKSGISIKYDNTRSHPSYRWRTVHFCSSRKANGVLSLVSKKGRKMRQQFYQEQLKRQNAATQLPEDGTPIFTLFTKTPDRPLWFPIASFQGDSRSKMLVNACKTIWGRRLYMGTLNRGVARSVFGKDFGKLLQNIVRQLPDLREQQRELQFAYDVAQKGSENNQLKKIQVTPVMGMTGIEWLRYRLTQKAPSDMQVAMKILKLE